MATVANNSRTFSQTLGSDSAGPFSLGFRMFDDDGLEVYVDGEPTTAYTISSDYSAGYDDAATVTFNATLTSGTEILIYGAMKADRQDDLSTGGLNMVSDLDIELARLAAMLVETQRDLRRVIRFQQEFTNATTVLTPGYFGFDASGEPTVFSGLGDAPVSAAMEPVVAAATLAAGRTALGLQYISDSGIDTTVTLFDNADPTIKLALDISANTTGTTRTWVVPDANGTFVGLMTTQTLSNKTLASPAITGTLTVQGTRNIIIDNEKISWGTSGSDYVTWPSTGGLVGYENGVFAWRIGSGATTRIQSVYEETTASAANINVDIGGIIKRSTSTGWYKKERRLVDGDVILDLTPVGFKSTHPGDMGRRFVGFISEQIKRVFPEASIDGGKNYDVRAIAAANVAKTKDHEKRLRAIESLLSK